MFLHIGDNLVVREKEVIGIFDFETSTLSKHTKNYLRDKEKKGTITTVSDKLPKAFVVVKKNKESDFRIYLTLISSDLFLIIFCPSRSGFIMIQFHIRIIHYKISTSAYLQTEINIIERHCKLLLKSTHFFIYRTLYHHTCCGHR